MKLNHKFVKIFLLTFLSLQIISAGLLFSAPKIASADIKESLKFSPNVSIPNLINKGESIDVGKENNGQMESDLLAKYIKAIYDYGMMIAGILAAIVLMAGGIIWLTSGGDSGKVGQAKELITGSVVGLVILFSSWIILNTVNPDLLSLRPISTEYIEKAVSGCCQSSNAAEIMSKKECDAFAGTTFYESTGEFTYSVSGTTCVKDMIKCFIKKDCNEKVEFCFNYINGKQKEIRENCGSYFNNQIKLLSEIKEVSCSKVSECRGNQLSCQNIEDGESCPDVEKSGILNDISLDGYCYGGYCYTGLGEESSRCGTKPGAYCSSITCSKLGTVTKKYYRDNSGGRKCATDNLYCCYTE